MSPSTGENTSAAHGATTSNGLDSELLAEVQPVLTEGAQFIREELRERRCSPVYQQRATYNRRIGERSKIWPEQVDRLFTKFVIASAGVIIRESGSDDDPEQLANELIHAKFEQDAQDPELAFLTPRVIEAVATTRRAQELAERVAGSLQNAITTSEDKYELLHFLLAPIDMPGQSSTDSQAEREIQALKLFDTFTALGDKDSSIGSAAATAITSGELDTLVGEELFDSIKYEDSLIENQSRREAENLLQLGSYLTGQDRDTVIDRLVTPEARALWPEILKKLFNRGLSDIAKGFAQTRQDYQQYLTVYRCLPPSVTEGMDLTHLAEDILLEKAKISSTDTDVPTPKRIKALDVVDRIEKRKRRRQPTPSTEIDAVLDGAQNPEGSTESGDKLQQTSRDLAYIKPNGSKAPEGSPECSKIFDDFITEHRDRTGLDQDMEKIREWLKTMDMSAGIPRGIKTLGSGQTLTRGEAHFSKVYQLKPSEAVGLSLSSSLGSKIRVIFVMENNTIGVLGIAKRDRVDALMKKVGIRGRPRRK